MLTTILTLAVINELIILSVIEYINYTGWKQPEYPENEPE